MEHSVKTLGRAVRVVFPIVHKISRRILPGRIVRMPESAADSLEVYLFLSTPQEPCVSYDVRDFQRWKS